MRRSYFGQRESAHVHEQDTAGEGLGNAANQVSRSAAEQEEERLARRVVGDRAQCFEQDWQSLHFIDYHQPFATAEHPFRSASNAQHDPDAGRVRR